MNYYIVPKETLFQHTARLTQHASVAGHYIDLPDGVNVLVKLKFHFDSDAARFESHPLVASLPSVSSSRKVGPAIAKHLAHMGVLESHSTFDVAEAAGKIMRTMKHRD